MSISSYKIMATLSVSVVGTFPLANTKRLFFHAGVKYASRSSYLNCLIAAFPTAFPVLLILAILHRHGEKDIRRKGLASSGRSER
jgi:hypothetical protein